ncbi:hypothetical protein E0485_04835 [Paenibacillus albiflavus]|uniref:HTH cro/C1-type domain-containing protein n=1 Tax=Paenibacillus albiflavus TaxID=2545760 RepID=A0A4R4EP75_9BACL|nr:helix-turn-helix domain-containing protein [Paenibacillus albiflavus]TCZ80178.1 hypothetical protein E0485_04835 [Paenibacillus albiflavus]
METTIGIQTMTILQYLALIHQVSYTSVCKVVGLSPQQFNDWVKKRRPVPLERLQVLADYFKVEANLLIDHNYYLRDLTPESKVDVQILYLTQKLNSGEESDETEAYQNKLAKLQVEKYKQALITRFTAILHMPNDDIPKLCEAFLHQIENGNENELCRLLQEKEG